MEDRPEQASVVSPIDLTPLALRRAGSHLQFFLKTLEDILPELPDDYERLLARRLADILQEPAPLTAEINLQSIPGVSSRQLGSLIALGKVLRPRFGRLRVTGVSAAVHHLLELTRTDQLFDVV